MLLPGFKVAETRNRSQLTTMVYDGHYVLCIVGLTAMIYIMYIDIVDCIALYWLILIESICISRYALIIHFSK